MDYGEVWRIQKDIVSKKISGLTTADYVILVEHPHVLTLGRRGNTDNILEPGLPVYHVERGGDVTYHGPGQQVFYPIIDLTGTELTLKGYVRALEQIVIDALSKLGVKAEAIEGKTGVWVMNKKIASIGVAVEHWVTYHGVALNVSTDLSYFHKIRPCGFSPEVMTSLTALLENSVDMEKVKESLLDSYARFMQTSLIRIEKGEFLRNEFGQKNLVG
jgi:lipoate-protein ligase B